MPRLPAAWCGAITLFLALLHGPVTANAALTRGNTNFRRPKPQHLQVAVDTTDSDTEADDGDDVDDADDDSVPEPTVAAAAPGTTSAAPSAVSYGPGGYPELPSVSSLFEAATNTLKAISSQAKLLQQRATDAGKADQEHLAKSKTSYERKLKHQESENRKIETAVQETSARIEALKLNNAAIKNHSFVLKQGNELMRKELRALQEKLQTSQEFAAKTLASTDDSKAKELDVLGQETVQSEAVVQEAASNAADDLDDDADDDADSEDSDDNVPEPAAPAQAAPAANSPPVVKGALLSKKTQLTQKKDEDGDDDDSDGDEDDEDSDDDDDDDGNETETSFLSLSTKRRRSRVSAQANANAPLLAEITTNVNKLATEEQMSQQHLKDLFKAAWEAGKHRHEVLEAKLESLNATETSLLHLQGKLKKAEAHLRETQSQLEAHLRAEGLFTQRLAHLALAPTEEAPHLLKAVPDKVMMLAKAPQGSQPKKAAKASSDSEANATPQ